MSKSVKMNTTTGGEFRDENDGEPFERDETYTLKDAVADKLIKGGYATEVHVPTPSELKKAATAEAKVSAMEDKAVEARAVADAKAEKAAQKQ